MLGYIVFKTGLQTLYLKYHESGPLTASFVTNYVRDELGCVNLNCKLNQREC